MTPEESKWLADALAKVPTAELAPLVNLGSSGSHFRQVVQPWIAADVFEPLERRGVEVLHCDLKREPGVDLVANVLESEGLAAVRRVTPRALVLSNVLEHVACPETMAQKCQSLFAGSGRIFITVPKSYPYHPDPIDTLYRPDVADVAKLFPGWAVEQHATLEVPTDYWRRLAKHPSRLLGDLAALPGLWRRFGRLDMSRLAWLRRPFSVTCVSLSLSARSN